MTEMSGQREVTRAVDKGGSRGIALIERRAQAIAMTHSRVQSIRRTVGMMGICVFEQQGKVTGAHRVYVNTAP
jgi:hypothetical protein